MIDARRLAKTLRSVARHFSDAAHELDMLARDIFAVNPRDNAGQPDDVLMATPIDELELSVRSWNCLRSAGVETVGQLAAMKRVEFNRIPHFGRKSRNEVFEVMANLGLTPREN